MFSLRRLFGHGWSRTDFNIPALSPELRPWRLSSSAGELLEGPVLTEGDPV